MQESNCKANSCKTLLYILLGALVCGMLWRFRGTHGWGSESGILNVGLMFTMFLVMIAGANGKTNPCRIALTAIAFTFSTPAWGTFLNQIKGVISSGPDPIIYGLSPVSGVIMMLLLGFSISGIYGILLGSMYSRTKWKLIHFIVLVAAFYGVSYLCCATVSHPILALFEPQAIDAFKESLTNAGISDGVYKTYMAHFDNLDWSKGLVGGRNYFAAIGTISLVISTCVSLLLTRYWIGDKTAAKVGLLSALSFAFAITFADLFFVIFGDTGSPALIKAEHIHAWGCWEYFTGFIAGGLLTWILLKNKESDVEKDGCCDFLPFNVKAVIGFIITAFVIVYCIIRPVALRYDVSESQSTIVWIASVILFLALVFYAVRTRLGTAAPGCVHFCKRAFLAILLIQGFVYYFGAGHYANYRNILDLEHFVTMISLFTAISFVITKIVKEK